MESRRARARSPCMSNVSKLARSSLELLLTLLLQRTRPPRRSHTQARLGLGGCDDRLILASAAWVDFWRRSMTSAACGFLTLPHDPTDILTWPRG